MIIRKNNVERFGVQDRLQFLARFHLFHLRVQIVLLNHETDQLGKIRLVFQMENVQPLFHHFPLSLF